ncbi:MAG: hypothetical protein JST42_19710, partial [Bacteroidetes bacterium]|nr:hypothetical protein [Bacteroidota bacterium]
LWHAPEHRIVRLWGEQGRVFTGWFQQWLFGAIHSISGLRYIRLISLAGWAGSTCIFYFTLSRTGLSSWTRYVTVAYFASAFFALVFIGWAVCVEAFVPAALSLIAGVLLFEKRLIPVAIVLGIAALFFYQTFYPFVLLPFYCLFLERKDGKLSRKMIGGLVYFFLGLVIYYILFKLSLKPLGFGVIPRTAISPDPLDRLGFFFSYPMNQAFNAFVFFDTGSVVSQLIFPVLVAAWVLFEMLYRKGKWPVKLRYILGMFAWWMLGYLPMLVSSESSGPYRSMPVLGIMVFLMMADLVQSLIREGAGKQMMSLVIPAVLLAWGGLVYYAWLAHPLRGEYHAIRREVSTRYNSRVKEVIVVRAGENGFLPRYGVRHYHDEIGLPSTFKEWTPEPLVKQLVYEQTGSREQAAALNVVSYLTVGDIPNKKDTTRDDVLFIDAHTLF